MNRLNSIHTLLVHKVVDISNEKVHVGTARSGGWFEPLFRCRCFDSPIVHWKRFGFYANEVDLAEGLKSFELSCVCRRVVVITYFQQIGHLPGMVPSGAHMVSCDVRVYKKRSVETAPISLFLRLCDQSSLRFPVAWEIDGHRLPLAATIVSSWGEMPRWTPRDLEIHLVCT